MSDDPRVEAAALARAFATHLQHLRTYRGVAYVSSRPLTSADSGDESVPADSAAPADLAAPVDSATPADSKAPAEAAAGATNEGDAKPAASEPALRQRAATWTAAKKLEYLRTRNVGDCQRCPLARTRRNLVFGVGDPEADLMFVGEAPGGEEDRRGEPFVGPAGQVLDGWLEQLGLERRAVYIANVLKCRPPGNRDPQPLEIDRCSPFLHAQIRAIEPKVIVALGRFAGCLLLGRQQKMYEMRRDLHRYVEPKSGRSIPLAVTYHPSYVLRRDRELTRGGPDPSRPIKSEGEKVVADLRRAIALCRE